MGSACQSAEAVVVEDSTSKIKPGKLKGGSSKKEEDKRRMQQDESSDDDFEAECGKMETRAEASKSVKMALTGKGQVQG